MNNRTTTGRGQKNSAGSGGTQAMVSRNRTGEGIKARSSGNVRQSQVRTAPAAGSGTRRTASGQRKAKRGEHGYVSIPDKIKKIVNEIKATAKDSSQAVDKPLLFIIMLLLVIGLIMMYSASYAYAYEYEEGNSSYYITRQVIYALLGLGGMTLVSYYPPKRIKALNGLVYGISIVLLIIVLLLPARDYVHRWIFLFNDRISFQPSEITKFSVILLCATIADTHVNDMETFKGGVLPFIVLLVPIVLLLIVEPHISCTILIMLITMTMMYVGGVRLRYFGAMGGISAIAMWAVISSGKISYSGSRISVWKDPFVDPFGKGWQNIQALYAISSGGLLGVGLGNSRQKYLYISEPQNDFVFAVVCEELGFVGAVGIMILFMCLIWRGFSISIANPNRFCKLLGIGITAQVGWQTLLNIAVVTKVIPNTGISLPFFSYGGTSLVMLLLEMGVLLGISRGSRVKQM